MKFSRAIIPILFFLTFISCNQGPVGPEGPAGRDAEIYSETIEIVADIDFGVADEFVSVASYGWNILDEETVDYGVVLAYLRFEGTTAWQSLPLSTPFENDLVVARYSYDIDNFDFIIEGEVADNNEANEELFDGDILRIIAIPPTMVAKQKGLDYNDYEAVVKAYNLKF
jgi:hypothetical protein